MHVLSKTNRRITKKLKLSLFGAAACVPLLGALSLWALPGNPAARTAQPQRGVQSASSHMLPSIRTVWPNEGAELEGMELLRVQVDAPDSTYQAYWSVNGGQLNKMTSDRATDDSYKVATVDVNGWGAQEHTLTYVVVGADGQETDRATLQVRVTAPPAAKNAKPAVAGTAITLAPANPANPNADINLYVDPHNPAAKQANEWRSSRPADAALMDKLAAQPQARWFGGWNKQVQQEVSKYVAAAGSQLPVLVLYNIPHKHCYSGGGAANYDQYVAWVQQVASGIGGRRALVIVEPDALPLVSCLSAGDQAVRYQSITKAVDILKANAGTTVYIDAGHGKWTAANLMAERLFKANIETADGFSLNVANFVQTDINISYGLNLSDKLNGRHFVIDTSRNGLGPAPDNEWCNPAGRAAGAKPTLSTGNARIDAYLWIKVLGESDGTCNGGPPAGQWWADYALGLIQRAAW